MCPGVKIGLSGNLSFIQVARNPVDINLLYYYILLFVFTNNYNFIISKYHRHINFIFVFAKGKQINELITYDFFNSFLYFLIH